MSNDSLAGQVVIITGAGRGLGRAEALEFARLGARVVVNDVHSGHVDAVVDEIRDLGAEALPSYDSVVTPQGGQAIVDAAVQEWGAVQVLVNNAGFMRPERFEDLSFEDLDAVLDVHLRAAFFVTQPAWRVMKSHHYGRIVMTGSSAGLFPHGSNSNYCAAKAGIFGLARALAFEGSDHGIHVNAVLPFASTDISIENPIPGIEEQRRQHGSTYDGEFAARRTPESVAPLVSLLASPSCTVTGETISACAGRFARVFVGVGDGWLAPTLDDITYPNLAAHLDAIRSTHVYSEPRHIFDEVGGVMAKLEQSREGHRDDVRS